MAIMYRMRYISSAEERGRAIVISKYMMCYL